MRNHGTLQTLFVHAHHRRNHPQPCRFAGVDYHNTQFSLNIGPEYGYYASCPRQRSGKSRECLVGMYGVLQLAAVSPIAVQYTVCLPWRSKGGLTFIQRLFEFSRFRHTFLLEEPDSKMYMTIWLS